jgi:L-ascorbate metabolism protein UlaG (beta-lactamase superfamily)
MKSSASFPDSIQLWRHATLLLRIGGYQFLIDPMLSPKDAMDPVQNAGNHWRIPMVDLPFDEQYIKEAIIKVDAILITHTHRDHWDAVAMQLIPKDKKIICADFEKEKIRQQGFTNVQAIEEAELPRLLLHQTGGQHGTGEIGKAMGLVSGIILKHNDQTVYIAGDTIYCHEVEQAIQQYSPQVIVVNAGGARFLTGDPITMDEKDVEATLRLAHHAKVIAVHMDTVNHCLVTREKLKKYFSTHADQSRLLIPDDGECISF